MMPDDFGAIPGNDAARFSPEEQAALERLGARARALLVKVLGAIGGRKLQVGPAQLHEATAEDLDITFRGGYVLAPAELTDPTGAVYPCLTLLNKEEIALLFQMESLDEAAYEEQVGRLGDVMSVVVDSLNLSLAPAGAPGPRLRLDAARQAELDGSGSIAELLGDGELLQVSYALSDATGEAVVSHLAPAEFFRALIVAPAPAAVAPAVGAGAGGAALGPSAFASPLGGDDFDLPEPASPAASPYGFAGEFGPAPAPAAGSTVRPAQFAEFGTAPEAPGSSNIGLILDVPLRITVELGRSTMSIREILDLGPGSVVELDKLAGEPVDVLVNDRPIAKGEVVVVEETFGVRITDIISPAKRVASFR